MSATRRYEVQVRDVDARLRAMYDSLPAVQYEVWDTELSKPAPFGRHRTRERAEAHAARLEAKA